MRTKQSDEVEFDDAFDERGQLRDGITRIKVPIRMMDSAGDLPKVHDADGNAILRQPGFTAKDAAARTARNKAYDRYDAQISQRWRDGSDSKHCAACGEENDLDANYCSDCGERFSDDLDDAADPTGVGSHGANYEQQEGASCTVNGSAGHLRPVDGKLVCIPDRQSRHSPDTAGEVRPELYDPAKGAIRAHGKGYNKDAKDQMMDSLYAERDRELREAWRKAR